MIVAITLAAEKYSGVRSRVSLRKLSAFNFYPTEITTQLPLNFYNL